jgi:NAD dependent epimerase/dehydratase
MSMAGKRVLVTGAGGFIGSHLTEGLVRAGATVRGMVHYNALGTYGWLDESEVRKEVEIVAGDITDPECVHAAMSDTDIVFHLAALIAIPYSFQAPLSYVNANIVGTLNVLQAARKLGTGRVLNMSTGDVYGNAHYVPLDEKHPLQAHSPYAVSKIGADMMAQAMHRSFGVPVVTTRLFGTYGPRQSARAVIPTVISQCLAGKPVIHLGKLTPTRDMDFVGNTVEGLIAAVEADEAIGVAMNLGTGREMSIGDLAALIIKLTGSEATIESEEARMRPGTSEIDTVVADISLARRLIGYEPRVGLEEGLLQTIDWMREHLGRYRPDVYAV